MHHQIKERAWVEISFNRLKSNIQKLFNLTQSSEQTQILTMVKADAYGHGIDIVAPACYEAGIRHFGVATLTEGMHLRAILSTDAVIHILPPVLPEEAVDVVSNNLLPTICSLEQVAALSHAALKANKIIDVHLDVDTGIGRSGIQIEQIKPFITSLKLDRVAQSQAYHNLRLTGVMTHYTSADDDIEDALEQHELFKKALQELGELTKSLTIHCSNSPATLVLGETANYQLIRPGLLLYGIEPATGMFGNSPATTHPSTNNSGDSLYLEGRGLGRGVRDLQPILSLKARVSLCRSLPKGASISYGKTYHVPDNGRTYATISIGYGDGYPRRLSNIGHVLLHGKRAPICGRICMDQFVVDVTDIPGVKAGDIATLIGSDGNAVITVNEIADIIATTPHEITTCLTSRVARIGVQ